MTEKERALKRFVATGDGLTFTPPKKRTKKKTVKKTTKKK